MPLSNKQLEYLAFAWQCFETEPKIDYEKFKTVAGLASAHSARELMRVTKNKLKEEYGALGGVDDSKKGDTDSAAATPKKATPKKTPKKAAADGADGEAGGKKRGRGRPKKVTKEEPVDDDAGDDDGSPNKKVKTEPEPEAEPAAGTEDNGNGEEGEEEDMFPS